MLKSNYDFLTNRGGMFEYRMSNYLFGFLQNIIANVISINNVYRSAYFAVAQDWDELMWYNFGRFWRILFIFDPIESVDPGVWYTEFSGDMCWDGDCTSGTADETTSSSR